jgi:AcrR family transcriptional regulator
MEQDQEAREKIIEVVHQLLASGESPEKITVRQIAELAGVGVGLINYHFGTKNDLLSLAVARTMAGAALDYASSDFLSRESPKDKVKTMLKNLYRMGAEHERLVQFQLTQSIAKGDMSAALFLVPVLKEAFPAAKEELAVRIIAAQVLLPLQVASLDPAAFLSFSGVDLRSEKERECFIEQLVDNVVAV